MSLANLKATTEYQEAVQATEDIDSPAVGFAKTFDYKGGLANQVNAVIKQNNTLLYLASKQSQNLVELEEKFDKLKQKVYTAIEKEIQHAELKDSISSLAKRLDHFSISEVVIQTHGYDTWQGGKSNLLVTMAMIGRLSNTSYMGCQYSVDNVVDHPTTTGITAIPGERRSIEELEGKSWNLKPFEQTTVRVPSRVAVNERLNRSLSLQFERYRQAPQPARYSVDQHDREILGNDHLDEDEEHFIGICLQAPQTEHIPCDICFCEDCLNEARILEEEPLNKVKRSNKPKRSRQSDWDDDERSCGKILVIQEKLVQNQQDFLDEYLPQWDDQLSTQKQRSELEWKNPFAAKRGKDHTVLHLSKNEEKDDDLPYLKFQKFKQLAAQIIKKHEEHAFPIATDEAESSTSYQPPPDATMGPSVYPPARQNPQPAYKPDYQFSYPQ
nr:TPA: orf y [Tanacetum cinerariifolium]